MKAQELIAFEQEVARRFDAGEIPGPVHLAGGNEGALIEIFKDVRRDDWVLSTYRSHLHALLHGVPHEKVMAKILEGRSMNLAFLEHRFLTSAIVGGMLPIAVGIAAALKRSGAARRVWCFVGDMCAMGGAYHESVTYAENQDLPVTFVTEDNGFSTDTPTLEAWGVARILYERTMFWMDTIRDGHRLHYRYARTWPHIGTKAHGHL